MSRARFPLAAAVLTVLMYAGLGPLPTSGQGVAPPASPFPGRSLSSARELLVNVDDSDWREITDRQPLNSRDEETLERILYRLPAIRLDAVQRLLRTDVSWPQLAEGPAEQRAAYFHLSGRAIGIERQDLLPEAAERLEFDHYFRVAVELEDEPFPVLVCTRRVPQAWLAAPPAGERISADGLFFKVGDASGPRPQLVFAAHRVAWHPDRESPALNVQAADVLLGNLGFDVGLWDDLPAMNNREITTVDRECFYQLLAALGRADSAQLQARATRPFSLVELLTDPRPHHGDAATLSGVARRVTKILVDDRDIQQRFQIDHYYQIDLFMLLGDRSLRIDTAESDRRGPVYSDIFPATVCVRRLPAGLAEGVSVRREVRMPAVFFKLWAYPSEFVAAFDKDATQRSPLFVASQPEVLPARPIDNPFEYFAISLLGVTFVISAACFLWQSRGRKRRRGPVERLQLPAELSPIKRADEP